MEGGFSPPPPPRARSFDRDAQDYGNQNDYGNANDYGNTNDDYQNGNFNDDYGDPNDPNGNMEDLGYIDE